MSRNCAVCST